MCVCMHVCVRACVLNYSSSNGLSILVLDYHFLTNHFLDNSPTFNEVKVASSKIKTGIADVNHTNETRLNYRDLDSRTSRTSTQSRT